MEERKMDLKAFFGVALLCLLPSSPKGITLSQGDLLVGDQFSSEIIQLNTNYLFVDSVSTPFAVGGLAVEQTGNILIGSDNNLDEPLVLRISPDGTILDSNFSVSLTPTLGKIGGLAIDPNGNIYAGSGFSGRIRATDANGSPVFPFTDPNGFESNVLNVPVSEIAGLAVDSEGDILVGKAFTGEIFKFDSTGALLDAFIAQGISRIGGLTISARGNIFVGDEFSAEIVQLDPNGQFISSFTEPTDTFNEPTLIGGLAFAPVPLPGAVWLFISGLTVLSVTARKQINLKRNNLQV
jgi:outer membrane protein assembly factor BamB